MNASGRRLCIVAASVMVSFSAIFLRWSDSPSMTMVFYRMLISAAIIIPFALLKSNKETNAATKKDLILAIFSGAVFAVHLAAYFESLKHIPIASCLVITDTAVFFVALFMLFFGETVSKKGWLVMAVAFAGCVMISAGDMTGENGLIGDLLALLSSLMFAVYAIIGRRVRSRMSTLAYTSVLYSSAAVTSLVIVCLDDVSSLACGPKDFFLAACLAVFCTILGHTVYNWGLKYEKASFVAITTLLEPVFGTILGLIIFSEIPGILVIIGSVVVLAGVYLFSAETEPEQAEK